MTEEFERARRYGGIFSLLILDLDYFKRVNDEHGHLAGDAVLRAAAKRVAESIRTSDIFGRYGGEEFAVMLPSTGLSAAMMAAEKFRNAISATPIEFGDLRLTITASIGVTAVRPDAPSYEALIEEADSALYRAKATGRNRCMAFEPSAATAD